MDDERDREAERRRALLHGAPRPEPRQAKRGDEVWRHRDNETGRIQFCELRNNMSSGAGWEVQIWEADKILVSRQCASERKRGTSRRPRGRISSARVPLQSRKAVPDG